MIHSATRRSIPMTLALLSINQPSLDAAIRLLPVLEDHTVDLYAKAGLSCGTHTVHTYDTLDRLLPDLWARYDGIIALMATGALIRTIAPHLQDKTTDPAVVVLTLALDRVIPLLGGHLAGANALAETLARRLPGCVNFVTTATDQTRTPALEMLAQERGWTIRNLHALASVSNRLLNGQKVTVAAPEGVFGSLPQRERFVRVDYEAATSDAVVIAPHIVSEALTLQPPLTLGIGCNRGTRLEAFEAALETFLARHRLEISQIGRLASFAAKADEAGLLAFADRHGWEITFFDAETIHRLRGDFSPSAAERFFDLPGVAEPSAVLGSTYRDLIIPKAVYHTTITIAGAI